MKLIPLSRGKYFAKIDEEDYSRISLYNWFRVKDGNNYYAATTFRGPDGSKVRLRMHNFILPHRGDLFVDHEDLDGLNNTRSNLRLATKAQNASNRRSWGSSKFLGVSKSQTRGGNNLCYWVAKITIGGKCIHLGSFPFTSEGEIEAAKIRDHAAIKHQGEFARLNFEQQI